MRSPLMGGMIPTGSGGSARRAPLSRAGDSSPRMGRPSAHPTPKAHDPNRAASSERSRPALQLGAWDWEQMFFRWPKSKSPSSKANELQEQRGAQQARQCVCGCPQDKTRESACRIGFFPPLIKCGASTSVAAAWPCSVQTDAPRTRRLPFE